MAWARDLDWSHNNRVFRAKRPGWCPHCTHSIEVGQLIARLNKTKTRVSYGHRGRPYRTTYTYRHANCVYGWQERTKEQAA